MQDSLSQTLALQTLPHFGPSKYWSLLGSFGSISEFTHRSQQGDIDLNALLGEDAASLWQRFLEAPSNCSISARVDKTRALAEQNGISILCAEDANYPKLLKETKRAPPILYIRGDINLLDLPQIAIVGSRKPTPAGQRIAMKFARDLCAAGFAITSGLALGIDTCAHRGALEAHGKTAAVLGSGLLNVYPHRNKKLAQAIVDAGGVIVSEFPLAAKALAPHFPQRNRIVSGLSCGTLVVEAALKSGSLITARCALQQDREVFAVPGSILSEVSRGCHAMIKSGAKLAESAQDIVSELHGVLGFYRSQLDAEDESGSSSTKLSEQARAVLECIGYENISLSEIATLAKLPLETISDLVLELELAGLVENTGLGFIKA